MAFPDEGGVFGFAVFFGGVHKGRVPAPCVGAREAHAAFEQIHGGLVAHACARRHVVALAIALARAGVDHHDLQRAQGVADALELSLHVGGLHHIAIGELGEVQLHAGLKAPLQRHLVDGNGRLLLAQGFVHRAMEMIRRVQVGAVVGRELHQLHRPALAIGQVALLQAGKEGLDLRVGVLMREVFDLGRKGRRVGEHIVF